MPIQNPHKQMKVRCPDCKKDRFVSRSTLHGNRFSGLCYACSRYATNQHRVRPAFRPTVDPGVGSVRRECNKCGKSFMKLKGEFFFLCPTCRHANAQADDALGGVW